MVQFAVTLKDSEWSVFRDGVRIEWGMSRSRAIERAEALAFAAEDAGEDVDLIVQSYTGELTERHSGGGAHFNRRALRKDP
jgi:hypothetical protein